MPTSDNTIVTKNVLTEEEKLQEAIFSSSDEDTRSSNHNAPRNKHILPTLVLRRKSVLFSRVLLKIHYPKISPYITDSKSQEVSVGTGVVTKRFSKSFSFWPLASELHTRKSGRPLWQIQVLQFLHHEEDFSSNKKINPIACFKRSLQTSRFRNERV